MENRENKALTAARAARAAKTPESIAAAKAAKLNRTRRPIELLVIEDGSVMPSWAKSHVEKAKQGKLRSCIVLKCGECSNWQREEIKRCTVKSCPLFGVRPYR